MIIPYIGKPGEGMSFPRVATWFIPHFRFEVCCAAGVLVSGGSADFLAVVHQARQRRDDQRLNMPYSTIRTKLYYPNGERISRCDIRSAIQSLANPVILAMVQSRIEAVSGPAAARSEASTKAWPERPVLGGF